jgi:hypothetical protein
MQSPGDVKRGKKNLNPHRTARSAVLAGGRHLTPTVLISRNTASIGGTAHEQNAPFLDDDPFDFDRLS